MLLHEKTSPGAFSQIPTFTESGGKCTFCGAQVSLMLGTPSQARKVDTSSSFRRSGGTQPQKLVAWKQMIIISVDMYFIGMSKHLPDICVISPPSHLECHSHGRILKHRGVATDIEALSSRTLSRRAMHSYCCSILMPPIGLWT